MPHKEKQSRTIQIDDQTAPEALRKIIEIAEGVNLDCGVTMDYITAIIEIKNVLYHYEREEK